HAPEPQAKLERLLSRFEARLRIVTPAIDLVEIIAARGHSTLSGALHLTHALRRDILSLSTSLPSTSPRQALLRPAPAADTREPTVVKRLEELLEKIDDAVPLLNLALTTSGAHLGGSLPEGVSPARLLQASALLARPGVRVGEPFVLRLYSLFVGSVRPKSRRDFTWKEDFGKCRLALFRPTPLAYELRILEDTNDGRYHAEDAPLQPPEWATDMGQDVGPGGKSIVIPLDHIASLYYTSAGSLLNIEDSTSPVLVLSVRSDAPVEDPLQNIADFGKLDSNVRWYALEGAAVDNDTDDSSDSECEDSESAELSEEDEKLAEAFDQLCTVSPAEPTEEKKKEEESEVQPPPDSPKSPLPSTPTLNALLPPLDFLTQEWNLCSLSLLEYIIRLASVEMAEQTSHLEVPDEKLRLYLQASTNAADDDASAGGKSMAGTPSRSARTPISCLIS
ncbi:Ran-specific GTPase-activating protein 30, partial [Coemansia furcata]